MKAKVIRDVASRLSVDEIDARIEAISEHEQDPEDIDGEDVGEKLTHLMLARRCRARIDAGEELKSVFREVMRDVRGVLENEDGGPATG